MVPKSDQKSFETNECDWLEGGVQNSSSGTPKGRTTGGVRRKQTHPTRLVTPEGVGGLAAMTIVAKPTDKAS